ncbi:MAG: hypothetical protein EZS28_056310, partial [Streblomastix strix]
SRIIAAALVMLFTVARLAELRRATLLSASNDEYIIQTTILKSPKELLIAKSARFPMKESAYYVGSSLDFQTENQSLQTMPKKYGGSATQ